MIILGRMLGRTQGYALSANAMRNQDTNPSLVFFNWQSVADSALVTVAPLFASLIVVLHPNAPYIQLRHIKSIKFDDFEVIFHHNNNIIRY